MDGVGDILKAQGLAGAFIMVLLAAIGALWRAYAKKDKALKELYSQRAVEREALVRLVETSNQATLATATATERRTDVLSDLGDAISTQANAITRYDDRVQSQADMFKEKLNEFREGLGKIEAAVSHIYTPRR